MTEEQKTYTKTAEENNPLNNADYAFAVIKRENQVQVSPIKGEPTLDDIYFAADKIKRNIDHQEVASMVGQGMVEAAMHAQQQAQSDDILKKIKLPR